MTIIETLQAFKYVEFQSRPLFPPEQSFKSPKPPEVHFKCACYSQNSKLRRSVRLPRSMLVPLLSLFDWVILISST